MDIKKKLYLLVLLLGASLGARGQSLALKTNLLYDALLNANAGVEVGMSPRWTLDVSGNYNAWTVNKHKWKHWLLQSEARYWFCERFAGDFLGFHLLGGQYNAGNLKNNIRLLGTDFSKLSDTRHQGWFVGAGVAYGHAWVLGDHWNLEGEIGIGWAYTRYDVYPCAVCGTKLESGKGHNYFGPTKAALNLVYVF